MSPETRTRTPADAWALLRAGKGEASGSELPTIRAEVLTAVGALRYSLGTNGEARILVPVQGSVPSAGIVGTRFLRVSLASYVFAGRSSRYIDLTCLSWDLELVFGEVVDEICKRLKSGLDGVKASVTTITDFRELLERGRESAIPGTAIVGLVGEMLYLNRLLDRSRSAWRAWRGPDGDRHDFRVGNSSLEVKTTSRAGNTLVTVHGIEQLVPPPDGRLHLLHLTLETVAGGMLTVSSLGRSALAKADDPARLSDLLASAGCTDVEDPAWNAFSYRLESESLYEVGEGFPMIVCRSLVDGMLPPGVSDLIYTIDLAFANHCRRDGAQAALLDTEFASC